MKIYFFKKIFKQLHLIIFLIPLISTTGNLLNYEYLFADLQTETTTKPELDSSVIPTNPFEIVEMIRRNNSLNDATNPSDAIDDALESFKSMEEI